MTPADLHNLLYLFADQASEAINPVLMVLVAEEPLRLRELRRSINEKKKNNRGDDAQANAPSFWPDALVFWGRTLLAVGAAVVLAELGKKMQVWPVMAISRPGTRRLPPQWRRALCFGGGRRGCG